ncbi:unnamed protein product [Strongylus vulgaris]|uniref:Uncharacterized protein n=1 Tax=Strongylus vulgaris TaxID=40348 RepID=A0A3P7INX6_STRVU|nr:unnamed protein product [Strongylus vulgaris]
MVYRQCIQRIRAASTPSRTMTTTDGAKQHDTNALVDNVPVVFNPKRRSAHDSELVLELYKQMRMDANNQ